MDISPLARSMVSEAIANENAAVKFPAAEQELAPVTLTYERDSEGWEFFIIEDGFDGEEVFHNRTFTEGALGDAIAQWLDLHIADGEISAEDAQKYLRDALREYAGIIATEMTA